MKLQEEDFPLYQLLIKSDHGAENAINGFKAAQIGGDEERYSFAMVKKTLQTCFIIFQDVASRGHAMAAYMANHFRDNGLRQPDMLPPRKHPAPN